MGGGMPPPSLDGGKGKGRGRGRGAKGGGRISASAAARAAGPGEEAAKRLQELEGGSVEAESNIEILRAQRAAARSGKVAVHDSVRENEGVDEDDPLVSVDDGIRIEPFNMRREMAEGHFDEGGFYILNKKEEKQVTDAWLDTVDQAERSASFKRVDRLKKAGESALSRISALVKNLGPDEAEPEEEEEESTELGEDGQPKKKPKEKDPEEEAKKAAEAAKEVEEEPEDAADEVAMLEALIAELLPLEKPSEALSRLARGGAGPEAAPAAPALEPLKTRARVKQRKAEEAAKAAQQGKGNSKGEKPKKRKFSEFGYEEAAAEEAPKQSAKRPSFIQEAPAEPPAPPTEGQQPAEPSSADKTDVEPPADAGANKSTVTDPEAVARAAAKAAETDKAAAEAAKAFAAELKMSRHQLFVAVDAKQGPEAAAMIASEVPRAARGAAEEAADEPANVQRTSKKRASEHGVAELERRGKIDRLTDLCDRLLLRGVLVYDSTREQLAIEVRERKGEMKQEAEGEEKAAAEGAAVPEAGAAEPAKTEAATPAVSSTSPAPVLYENKRFKPGTGDSALSIETVGDSAPQSAPAASGGLLWQYRWTATPTEIHGPFDSVTMQGWAMNGCFSDERPAEIRQCDEKNEPAERCWHRWEEINFALYV